MAERPLDPDEAALWARVLETVRPAAGRRRPAAAGEPSVKVVDTLAARVARADAVRPRASRVSGQTLDGSWDRGLARGTVTPDRTIDLHGHSLSSAYVRIDRALADAIAAGDRLVLLIAGKPGGERPGEGRGAIRAVVGDWLAASRHAGRIAAIRNAHPRHGGAGALYLVLRRR